MSRPVGEHFDKGLVGCNERDPEVAVFSQADSIRKAWQTVNHHFRLPPLNHTTYPGSCLMCHLLVLSSISSST